MKNRNTYVIRIHYFIVSFVVFIGMARSQAQIVVDANLSDWDTTQFAYDDQNKLWYDFRKDEQFLYFSMLKKENAGKTIGGGVQLSFAPQEVDGSAFRITFAHAHKDPHTGKRTTFSHEVLELANDKGGNNGLLPVYNETGISAQWHKTNIEYVVIRNGRLYSEETPKDPNIFRAEVQIPLRYLAENIGNPLHFSICLRGADLEKKGEQHLLSRRLFDVGKMDAYSRESVYEFMYYTEFFGTLDLDDL